MPQSRLQIPDLAKSDDGSVRAELDRISYLLYSVRTSLHNPPVLAQIKRRLSPPGNFMGRRPKEYSLQDIMHGIALVLIQLDQESTDFSFSELLYHIHTFRICSQALGMELIESAKRLEAFCESSCDWTVDRAIGEFVPKLQVHHGPYYVCDEPIAEATQAIRHLCKYFCDHVYIALGVDSYWNVENLTGIRPKDKKSLWLETYNLLEKEGSGDRPFDEALPYKLACMGSTVSIYGLEARNWILSLTEWMRLPCAMAVHSRLGRNSPMRCLNDDLLSLLMLFVIED